MPALNDDKLEVFAHGLARGMARNRASREAGFVNSSGKRVVRRETRPDVIARVAEILKDEALDAADPAPIIKQMLEAATKAGELGSAAGFVAMRALLIEAARMKAQASPPAAPLLPVRRRLTDEEWVAKYAPKPGARP